MGSKHIRAHFPIFLREMVSPFFGGGAIEWHMAANGTKVHAYDLNPDLVSFWNQMLTDPLPVAEHAKKFIRKGIPLKEFKELRKDYLNEKDPVARAAKHFAVYRMSFSGFGRTPHVPGLRKATNTMIYQITEATIQKIRDFKAENITIKVADFQTSLAKHPDIFAYIDPPYIGRESMYEICREVPFNHIALRDMLANRKNFVLSYNDSEEVRELYKDFEIHELKWKYSMPKASNNPRQMGHEILITPKETASSQR